MTLGHSAIGYVTSPVAALGLSYRRGGRRGMIGDLPDDAAWTGVVRDDFADEFLGHSSGSLTPLRPGARLTRYR